MVSEVRWKLNRLILCIRGLLESQGDKISNHWQLLDSFTEHLRMKLDSLAV
jgi:hypothetical protein